MANFQFVINQGNQTKSDDCTVYMDLYCIHRCYLEGFNFKMLLHPFEEQLYFPSFLVEKISFCGIQLSVIGQAHKVLIMLSIIVFYSLQLCRIFI